MEARNASKDQRDQDPDDEADRCVNAPVRLRFFFLDYTASTGQPVGYQSGLRMQHFNTHKQQLHALGLQIISHHIHAPVHKQSTGDCH